MPTTIKGLYAVTPDSADTEWLVRAVEAAIRGGAGVVQYRNKWADESLRLRQARRLAELCRRLDAALIVNDSISVALESGAHGVHLGREDGELAVARRLLGKDACIGVSCYDEINLARRAVGAGADYVAFGSFFPSPTKPDAVRAPLELLRVASRELGVPVVAIGGIDHMNAGVLQEAGADAIAVISAVFGAADIEQAARRLSASFERSRTQETIP